LLQTSVIIDEESPNSLEMSRDLGSRIDTPCERLSIRDKDSLLKSLIKDLTQSRQEEGKNLLPMLRCKGLKSHNIALNSLTEVRMNIGNIQQDTPTES
jgi:hypothetical protein